MKHFDTAQWADFVRGFFDRLDRAVMDEHLSSGCAKCRRTVETLRKLVVVANAETNCEVPPYAVHYAKSIQSLQQPERVQIDFRNIATLIYDSFREPLPAGIRSQSHITRYTRYHAGDVYLDLRQEHKRGSSQVTLIGQIGDEKEPDGRMANVEVILTSGKETVARAISNQFGEFLLAYEPKPHLRLNVLTTIEAS